MSNYKKVTNNWSICFPDTYVDWHCGEWNSAREKEIDFDKKEKQIRFTAEEVYAALKGAK